ncbi:mechanosensitive ion channel family protein [Sulfuriroseicoccus oceanibius]|uniref:Mechanosensitive ion channel n=1 Tax=Sulfuriroseicoccus oceanibius TaxID=2707525 RepID=A0A6B3LA44_9BACT|nr:mechanosensitive ion channel domain-containing protein [Sulfuriroseicoccus oceanibius]QQL46145.1 mechanosensitive ion channel [Sulfuriroseicoccus oceanibius]
MNPPLAALLTEETLKSIQDQAWNMAVGFAPKLVTALLILLIGWKVAKWIGKLVGKALDVRHVDATLKPFLCTLISAVVKVAVVLSALSTLGIQSTSFIAVLGAAGLAIGMSLKGTLSNFAGGVLILFQRPIQVGEFIEAGGHSGTVKEVNIFNTVLTTPDNKVITIPNNSIATGSLVNFSRNNTRRVDLTFGIGYGDDIDQARSIIQKLIDANPHVLKDPEPSIFVASLADSSVNLGVRVWTETSNYWAVLTDLTEKTKKTFDAEGISIPFPQMDVHVQK